MTLGNWGGGDGASIPKRHHRPALAADADARCGYTLNLLYGNINLLTFLKHCFTVSNLRKLDFNKKFGHMCSVINN